MQLRPWFTQSLQKPLHGTELAIEAVIKMFHADTGRSMPPCAHSLCQNPQPGRELQGKQ